MAEPHVISLAISDLLQRQNAGEVVKAVRGEFFFHQAQTYDLMAESGGPVAEQARAEADRCRQQGRLLLGRVA